MFYLTIESKIVGQGLIYGKISIDRTLMAQICDTLETVISRGYFEPSFPLNSQYTYTSGPLSARLAEID